MSQTNTVDQQISRQFLELYQRERHQEQVDWYENRVKEFTSAQRQAVWLSIALIFITAISGATESFTEGWLRTTLLILAAICPILSTALAGYSALHGFTQQAKLYRDARRNLSQIRLPLLDLDQVENVSEEAVAAYVNQVEDVLVKEHSYWGQLTEDITVPGA